MNKLLIGASILGGVLFSLIAPASAGAINVAQTRYGVFDGSSDALMLNGHPTQPRVTGNSTLFVRKIGESGEADLLFVTSVGGRACPSLYSIVKVTVTGIEPTAFFGNCDERAKVAMNENTVTVALPAYVGPLSMGPGIKSPAATFVYSIDSETLTKNGSPINTACKSGVCAGI
ncbi:hypothetical protein HLH33_00510 [Gluconacetobacter diazotrophicus]|uniref:Uncharacterized protein n=1 Tax=Gluconacetobacter diazotrophicus TaxID=33996 RepID=A0A7W4I3F3_GLUDI|nr:hypothetical protein [Gluconacetobacter diazotrophicus]MBB2154802.1 hypothetical protein [Gluconacetobacter diazotrophicus]